MSLRVLLNNSYVELDADNILVPLTFSVADMKSPDKRRTSSSKTITLQGTQRNLNILRNVYSLPYATFTDASLNFIFDPRTRIEAQYEENGVLVFDGLFQVLKARRIGERYEFECLLFSNIANVIQELGDLKLTDLDWSEYQHELGSGVVIDSWGEQVIKNGSPVSNFSGGVPDGFGYIYGWFDMGLEYPSNTPRFQKTNQIPLGVYFKETLQKVMAAVNQPYTFTLDNTELWKRLTLFNEGGQVTQISQPDIDSRAVDIVQDVPAATVFVPQQGQTAVLNYSQALTLTTTNNDPSSQVQNFGFGSNINIARTGSYKVELDGALRAKLNSTFSQVNGLTRTFGLQLWRNGVLVQTLFTQEFTTLNSDIDVPYSNEYQLQLNAGDVIDVRLAISINVSVVGSGSMSVDVEALSGFDLVLTCLDGEIEDTSLIDIVRYLPQMKCADFYKSTMRMFNLYQQDEPDGSILIIPAKDYYQGTNSNETEDWSDLVDYSEVIEIEPPNRIEGKNYQFRYTEENDVYHQQYRQEFAQNYGDFTYTVPNTWQVGENVLQVDFALGIPVEIKEGNVNSGVIMPSIYQIQNLQEQPYKGRAPRVYVYNGLRLLPIQSNECVVLSSDESASTVIVQDTGNSQPFFHHMLNPFSPTFDIAFGQVQRLYYPSGSITNSNLYITYWDRFIRELTSEDAKILTAYFKLNTMDIHRLNFRRLKNIDGVVYRLNIVEDYVGQNVSTKCELIKVIEGQSRRIRTTIQNPPLNPFVPPTNNMVIVDIPWVIPSLNIGQFGLNIIDNILYIGTPTGAIRVDGQPNVYNFHLIRSEGYPWSDLGITDAASLVAFLVTVSDYTTINVANLVISGTELKCNVNASGGTFINLKSFNIASVINIGQGWDSLISITLKANELTQFNPVLPIPSSVEDVYLNDNNITTVNFTVFQNGLTLLGLGENNITSLPSTSVLPTTLTVLGLDSNDISNWAEFEPWATNQPQFTNPCTIFTGGNPTDPTGSTFKTIVESTLNATVTY